MHPVQSIWSHILVDASVLLVLTTTKTRYPCVQIVLPQPLLYGVEMKMELLFVMLVVYSKCNPWNKLVRPLILIFLLIAIVSSCIMPNDPCLWKIIQFGNVNEWIIHPLMKRNPGAIMQQQHNNSYSLLLLLPPSFVKHFPHQASIVASSSHLSHPCPLPPHFHASNYPFFCLFSKNDPQCTQVLCHIPHLFVLSFSFLRLDRDRLISPKKVVFKERVNMLTQRKYSDLEILLAQRSTANRIGVFGNGNNGGIRIWIGFFLVPVFSLLYLFHFH